MLWGEDTEDKGTGPVSGGCTENSGTVWMEPSIAQKRSKNLVREVRSLRLRSETDQRY